MLLGLSAPLQLNAHYRGLSGRAAKFAARHSVQQQKEMKDLKAERDDLAVKVLKGNPAAYLALEKNMNGKLVAAGAAAALAAATIYGLQKKISKLNAHAANYSRNNNTISTEMQELVAKNKAILRQLNQLTGKNLTLEQANQELAGANTDLTKRNKKLSEENEELGAENLEQGKFNTDLKQAYKELNVRTLNYRSSLINKSELLKETYQRNLAFLAQLQHDFNQNSMAMKDIAEEATRVEQTLNTEISLGKPTT